jgi:hypothetical protein
MSLLPFLRNVNREFVNLPGVLTVDNGPDDGRFLPAMRIQPGARQHGSLRDGLRNIAGEREGTLVGHGLPAFVAAGIGDRLGHSDGRHLCLPHHAEWEAIIDGLTDKRIERLTIFACSAGDGEKGANLVFALAKKLNATVRAPMGDVWVDEATQRTCTTAGSGWREATPAMAVAPTTPAARPRLALTRGAFRTTTARDMLLLDHDRLLPLPLAGVKSVQWTSTLPDVVPPERKVSDDTARSAAAAIAFHAPIVFGGPLASFVTGRLTLAYQLLGREHLREFLVHNDRLIEDTAHRGVFYEVDLEAMMSVLR